MSGLRFCMVTTFYPPHNFGGDGIAIRRLARALVRRGHHVEVIHDVDAWRLLSSGPEPSLPDDDDGVVVHRLESDLGPLSPLLTHQTGRPVVHGDRIRGILEDGEFDVINYHNVSLVGGPGVLSLGKAAKLYTAHEHWLVCPTHVLWRHDREPCTGRECFRCLAHHRRPPQAWRHTGLLGRELEHVDVLLARSEFSRKKHREFGLDRDMTVLPDFLPDATAEPAGPPHPRPYFLFAGRLEKLKGLQDVLPTFRGEGDADLVVAGEGGFGSELRLRAADSPRVRFLGRVPPSELRRWYRHSVALVAPSLGFETFGLTLIEAFREGTPVVARRRGPFPEIVETCGGGLLFRDRRELEGALGRLLNEPGFRDRLGDRAREGFLERWAENVVVPRYLDLVRRVSGPGRGKAPGGAVSPGRPGGSRCVPS